MRRRDALALLAAPALTTPPAVAAIGAARAQEAPAWRVGALFPLSGPAALLGDEAVRGLELAVEAANAANGRRVRLLRADTPDAAAALDAARRLVRDEGVNLLFGSVNAAVGTAARQAAAALNCLFVELACPADSLLQGGGGRFIRSAPGAAQVGLIAALALRHFLPDHLQLAPDAMRVVLLHETGQDHAGVAEAMASAMAGAGLPAPERLTHAPRSGEWPVLVQRLRAARAEVVVHACGEGDIGPLVRALGEAGWRPRALIGVGPAWGLVDVARSLEPALDGCFAIDMPPIRSAAGWARGAAGFAEEYLRRWGSPPRSGLSLAAYAAARVVLGAGQTTPGRLRAALGTLERPRGSLANGWGWRLAERGQNHRALPALLQWQAGRAVAVFPEAVAAAPAV